MKIFLIAGARPNFMKIAPIFKESLKHGSLECRIVHTGQHYDYEMSQTFFEDLELPEPHYFLNAGSGSHAAQTARVMTSFEETCARERPNLVVVVGDVNSTLACSIVAKKMLIEVAHVEAGLRSFDLAMPEEINRMVTDSISDYFFVTEQSAQKNLLREGKDPERIFLVGNVMIDNLYSQLRRLKYKNDREFETFEYKKNSNGYLFLTLHRPSNVDDYDSLKSITEALNEIAASRRILFPVHPRTKNNLKRFNISLSENIISLPPLSFSDSLYLWKDAAAVLTDSGGLQEETTALGVPCVTIRNNTERPITIEQGTNILAGTTKAGILQAYDRILHKKTGTYAVPDKWDGMAAKRIWEALLKLKNNNDVKEI